MNIKTMRTIDEVAGKTICRFFRVLLAAQSWLGRIFPKKAEQSEHQVIMVQKYFGMGSILHSIPLMRGVRKKYPLAKIIFVTFKPLAPSFRLTNIADEVIVLSSDSFISFVTDFVKAVIYLRKQKVSISLDLEFFSKFTMIMAVLSGAKMRIGFFLKHIRPRGVLTHPIFYNSYQHIQKMYCAFGTPLGIEQEEAFFSDMLPSSKKLVEDPQYLTRLGIDEGSPYILINPNASEASYARRWPADYFLRIIDQLVKTYPNYQFALIGSPAEEHYVNSLHSKLADLGDKVLNLAGKTTLYELFALMEEAYLLITNDTGPMHIASLYGTNLVVFFGPETPKTYGPINDNSLVFYDKDIYCSPCLNVYDAKNSVHPEDCNQPICLEQFKPEEVFKAISEKFF
ncbi:MAG: glycosyltransferase family 9 protein [Magnetococcales bacterium]|nr:glycosyltransferase family 9 protein [Magnetococcales bacterium]